MTKENFLKLVPGSVLIVDIREDNEVLSLSSPAEASHIPMQTFAEQIQKELIPKDKKIITVCYSGARCRALQNLLANFGYESDYLEGGIARL
jgi:rhodanese-related sulfurtransferase